MGVIKVELVHALAEYPKRHTEKSVGYDISVVVGRILAPGPGHGVALDTGIRFHMEWPDYIELKARSSSFVYGLLVHPGIIDPDFTETVKVLVANFTRSHLQINPGTRLAQFILGPHQTLEPIEHLDDARAAWSQDLPRRTGGIGSTGR